MCIGFMFAFLYCYFATLTSDNLIEISDFIYYNTDWYTYNKNFAKYSILIMAKSQRTFYFTGLKIIRCNLQSFTKVDAMIKKIPFITHKTKFCFHFNSLQIQPHHIVLCFEIYHYAK